MPVQPNCGRPSRRSQFSRNGKITLLTRKLFNVLLAVAQQADDSGDTYRALLSDIVANSAFDSNDTALVKEHLRRMVSVQVEWSTGTSSQKPGRKWGSRR